MRTTEMVLCAHYLKTSKFIPVCISIYILSLGQTFCFIYVEFSFTKGAEVRVMFNIDIVNILMFDIENM